MENLKPVFICKEVNDFYSSNEYGFIIGNSAYIQSDKNAIHKTTIEGLKVYILQSIINQMVKDRNGIVKTSTIKLSDDIYYKVSKACGINYHIEETLFEDNKEILELIRDINETKNIICPFSDMKEFVENYARSIGVQVLPAIFESSSILPTYRIPLEHSVIEQGAAYLMIEYKIDSQSYYLLFEEYAFEVSSKYIYINADGDSYLGTKRDIEKIIMNTLDKRIAQKRKHSKFVVVPKTNTEGYPINTSSKTEYSLLIKDKSFFKDDEEAMKMLKSPSAENFQKIPLIAYNKIMERYGVKAQ